MPVKNISTKHPLYTEYEESWLLMRDAMDGEDRVKELGVKYLPMKTGTAIIANVEIRSKVYNNYLMRAEFPELVSPTVRGSVGLICEKEPTIELPAQLQYLLEDATGDGTTLAMLFQRIVTEQLVMGRYGLLPAISLSDPSRFVIAGYIAERIINWDKKPDGMVDFVVLDESEQERDRDNNTWSLIEKYMECSLEEGTYQALRYRGNTPEEEPVPAMMPNGKPLDRLPFVFIDTADLTADPDEVPLYGLAKLALRVYRLDADYMQGLHMTSEPTPYITGFSDPKKAIENGEVPTTIGASNIWILPEGATADFLEFSGPGLEAQAKAISSALERAVLFGAQLLSENTRSAESGESRKLRLRGQQSLLKSVASTAGAGLERTLRNIAIWAGLDPNQVKVKPNLDFIDFELSAQDLTALVAGWQSGGYSKRTFFENIQRAGMVPSERTFEDEEEFIQTEGLVLGNVGRETNQPPGGSGGSGG